MFSKNTEQQLKTKIAELKKENQKLQKRLEKNEIENKTENELHGFFQAMREIILEIDKDGTYLSIAPTSPDLLYLPAEELIGKQLHEVFPKKQADDFLTAIRKTLKNNEVTVIQYPLNIAENEQWFEARLYPKTKTSILFIACEITDRINAEEQLKKTKERFHNIFETAGVSIWVEDFSELKQEIDDIKKTGVKDFNTYLDDNPNFVKQAISKIRILDVNTETLKMYKADSKEQLLKSLHTTLVDESLTTIKDEIIAMAQENRMFITEEITRNLEGEYLYVLLKILFPPAGEPFDNIIVSMMDISRQKQAEKLSDVMINIFRSIANTDNLDELYKSIHNYLSEIVDTTNFYVCLYDKEENVLNFPYCVDKYSKFSRIPAEKTLTSYIVKEGRSLFADQKTMQEMHIKGIIGNVKAGKKSKVWLGVPLFSGGKAFGAIAVQSYDDPNAFSQNDLQILEFVSDTIALAIMRKQSEEKLTLSEKRYRDIYNKTTIGLYRTQPDGEILMVNPAALKMLGYDSFDELKNRNLELDGYAPNYSRSSFKEAIDQLGEIKGRESCWIRKDGKQIFVRESATAIHDEHGKILYYDGVVEDITEKKHREVIRDVLFKISQSASTITDLYTMIKAIREHLSELIDTTNFGVAIYEEDEDTYYYPYYRDQMEEISGDHKERIPNSLTDYVRKTGRSLLVDKQINEEFCKENRIEDYGPDSEIWLGVPLITANGTIGVLSVQSYEDEHAYSREDIRLLDSVAGSIAIVIEKKKAEKALRDSQQQLTLALESAGLGLWDHNFITGKIYRNERWARMLGYEPQKIEKDFAFFRSLVHPDDLEKLNKISTDVEANKIDSFAVNHRVRTKDGVWKWVYNWGKIVERDDQGDPVRAVGTHLDITQLKKNEEELLIHQEHIKLVNRILRHDIANCFAIINSALNIYKRTGEKHMLAEAVKQIKKGTSLIRRMKQLEESRIIDRKLKPYNLKSIISKLIRDYDDLYIKTTGDDEEVLADEALESALDNILSNARKHAQATELMINISRQNGTCLLSIADNGKGIADEVKEKIFDESFTFGSSGHTGLGLYIVKKTIERYGGNVYVRDNDPKGTIFEIQFVVGEKSESNTSDSFRLG